MSEPTTIPVAMANRPTPTALARPWSARVSTAAGRQQQPRATDGREYDPNPVFDPLADCSDHASTPYAATRREELLWVTEPESTP
jgi:hypothetical protein